MRAKLVYESLQFQRSSDPRQVLNIGQRAIIEEWFRDIEQQLGDKINYTIDNKLNIIINQHLFLDNLNIDWLPDNLSVRGSLDLRNTKITELPENLSVIYTIWISTDMKDNLVAPAHLKEKIRIA